MLTECRFGAGGKNRRGVVLLIITGLASVILVLATAFMYRMRASAAAMQPVMQEAQARLMLHAALMYIQETSRLGWGHETYGWTDVRDGSLGPRGPRVGSGNSVVAGDYFTIPEPVWWQGGSYGQGWPEDSQLGAATWPMPGSVLRVSMQRLQTPPYAVRQLAAPNPLIVPKDTVTEASDYTTQNQYEVDQARFLLNWAVTWNSTATGSIDRPPVNTTLGATTYAPEVERQTTTFRGGNTTPVADSVGKSWFRIYREILADHDGLSDARDRVVISEKAGSVHRNKNWNVFVITAGAGQTRGYRDWAEVTAAGASDLFGGSQILFNELRAAERLSWWRVEWSGAQAGNYEPRAYTGGVELNDLPRSMRSVQSSFGGNFKWLQRLDVEPATW